MGIGDLYAVETGDCADIYYVDTGMYDTPEYGAVYIIDAERPAIVDTGMGTRYENILAGLESVGIAPEDLAVIAPTHIHLDHAGGAGYLVEACPNAEVVCHELGAPHLIEPSRLWEGTKRAVGTQIQFYTEPRPVPEERITTVTDGDVVDLGDHRLDVHHAPGHAPHHCVFFDPTIDALFTADVAGIYAQRTDEILATSPPPNFDFEQVVEDARMCQALDPETLLYAHYGPAPADDRLEEYVEVTTEWVERIDRLRDEYADDEALIQHLVDTSHLDELWGETKGNAEVRMNAEGVLRYLDLRE
jgi:glyoxylase-like metal-dependent hydrolase (beta-lactamase superfamily II)